MAGKGKKESYTFRKNIGHLASGFYYLSTHKNIFLRGRAMNSIL
jgi:hypothetical protein